MKYRNIIILLFFLLLNIFICFGEEKMKAEIIFDQRVEGWNFNFINDTDLLLYSRNKISILNAYKGIIKILKTDYDMEGNLVCLNNKVLFLKILSDPRGDLHFYNLIDDKVVNISKNFNKYEDENFYWDFYENNKKIIFQYFYKDLESQSNDGVKGKYNIYKYDLIKKDKKLLVENAVMLDYNHGYILYQEANGLKSETYTTSPILSQLNIINENEKLSTKVLYNDKTGEKEKLNNFPSQLKNIRILKDKNFIAVNKKNELVHINKTTGESSIVGLKTNITIIDIRYNFNSDLLGINYFDNKHKNRFMIIKIRTIFNSNLFIPTVSNLRFRETPDLNGKFIRSLNQGEKLELIEKGKEETINGVKGTWVKVKTEKGEIGWCFSGYLEEWTDEIKKK